MTWAVAFHEDFDAEFREFSEEVQDELLAMAKLLEQFGPMLKRPRADTLSGSKHANMKELRFSAANGAWPSPSTLSARPSSWSAVTKPVSARSNSTGP